MVVGTDGEGNERVILSGRAPAWMSTAGSGDVLAGMLGALLAQQDDMLAEDPALVPEVVAAGAYIHGLAGSIASRSEQRGWHRPQIVWAFQKAAFRGNRPSDHRERYYRWHSAGIFAITLIAKQIYRTPAPTSVALRYTSVANPYFAGRIFMTSPSANVTDVVFDFCGVLIDWQTRACLEGRYPQVVVDVFARIMIRAASTIMEDRMDHGEDFEAIYPDVVREQGEEIAEIFRDYIERYGDALPRMIPDMEQLLRDLKAAGYGVWGLTNWSHETFHFAFERFPAARRAAAGHGGVRRREDAQAERRHLRTGAEPFQSQAGIQRVLRRHREERHWRTGRGHARVPLH